MGSPLAEMLREELALQRIFLSGDEVEALGRPLSYDDEQDLAWDRIKHRRLTFFSALRDRYIHDGRPLADWRAMIAAEEAAAGGPTYISQLAVQVITWAARTSDRGAMLSGFGAKTLHLLGLLALFLAAFSWWSGAALPVVGVVGVAGALLVAAGRALARVAAERAARAAAAALGGEAAEVGAGEEL